MRLWTLLLSLILFAYAGCGNADQGFAGGPVQPGPGAVADLQLRFDFPDARLPNGVAELQVQLFSADGENVRDFRSPRTDQLLVEDLTVGRYLVRTRFFDATGAPIGYSDQTVDVQLPGPTVLEVDILLTGAPPPSTLPETGTAPVRLAFLLHPQDAASDTAQPVQVVALDAAGNPASFAGNVNLTLSEGSGVLSGTLAGPTPDFSVLVVGSGPHRLLASADGLEGAESVPFQIVATAPVATGLRFLTEPGTGAVGQQLATAEVEVLDQFGNRLVTATNAITLGGLGLNGTLIQNAVDGVASFPGLSPTEAGSFRLTASADGLTSATSSLTVDALTATTLNFVTVPAATKDGQTFSVEVEVLDQFGARLDGASAITLSLSSAPANMVLGGPLTQNAVNGLATFPGLSLADAAGTVALLATSPDAASAVSSDIAVTLFQGRLYVVETSANRVTSYNTGRGAGPLLDAGALPVTTIATGLNVPISAFIDTVADRLFLANAMAGRVLRFPDASTNDGVPRNSFVSGSFPRGIAYDAATDSLFVGQQSLAEVYYYQNASTGVPAIVNTISGFPGQFNDIAYDPAADRLFVAVQGAGVFVFDDASTTNGTAAATVDRMITAGLTAPQSLCYEPRTRRLYVGNSTAIFEPQVVIFDQADTTDNPPVAATLAGGAVNFGGAVRGLAVDFARDELYVSDSFPGSVKIFADASAMTGATDVPADREFFVTDPSGLTLDLTRD